MKHQEAHLARSLLSLTKQLQAESPTTEIIHILTTRMRIRSKHSGDVGRATKFSRWRTCVLNADTW